jgi:hypothetical protein
MDSFMTGVNPGYFHRRSTSNPNPGPGPRYLSTRIDYDSTRASIDTLMSVAPEFRLDADGALETLAQVARAAARWREVAVSHGLQQHDLDMM